MVITILIFRYQAPKLTKKDQYMQIHIWQSRVKGTPKNGALTKGAQKKGHQPKGHQDQRGTAKGVPPKGHHPKGHRQRGTVKGAPRTKEAPPIITFFFIFILKIPQYLALTGFKYVRQALYFLTLPWVIRGNIKLG